MVSPGFRSGGGVYRVASVGHHPVLHAAGGAVVHCGSGIIAMQHLSGIEPAMHAKLELSVDHPVMVPERHCLVIMQCGGDALAMHGILAPGIEGDGLGHGLVSLWSVRVGRKVIFKPYLNTRQDLNA